MRTFTIRYDHRGRAATATVQGNEITTMNDLLCVRHDGMPIAAFPKEDVLHVTSHGADDDWPAPADENPGTAPWSPVAPRPRPTPMRPRSPIHHEPQRVTGVRVTRRVVGRTRPFVS